MDKMDKLIRLLLALGIAILFPVLVYFTVLTVLPKVNLPTVPQYPQRPNDPYCNSTYYDYSTGTYKPNITSYQCQLQQQSYQQKLRNYDSQIDQYSLAQKQYQSQQDKYNKRTQSDRAVLAIVIALAAMAFSAYMRHSRELAGGLMCGSTLIIVVGVSSIIGYMGSTKKDSLAVAAITLSFGVLTALLYYLDMAIPNTTIKTVTTPVPAATHPPETEVKTEPVKQPESTNPAPPNSTPEA
jgi:hypothetical protein